MATAVRKLCRKTRFWCALVLLLAANSPLISAVQGYYRFPAIHDDTVVFAAEGDLWRVAASGGLALRLTTHNGSELFTKIHPAGKLIAFSGDYHGNRDVFVMPIDGGEPRRLTFHPARDEVVAWSADGESVVFRSSRASNARELRLFRVAAAGGHPEPIDIGPAALVSFAADGRRLAFNRFSREFRNWKRYYGGRAQDVWVGDLESGTFSRLTDWKGTDRFPMWHGERIYFASDRSGTMNLYRMGVDGGGVEAVTHHTDYDVRWPDLNGDRIVYMLGGDLWITSTRGGEAKRIPIEIPSDRVRQHARFEDASKTVEGYVLDTGGKNLAICSRGEIWTVRTNKGRRRQLMRSSGVREREPVFSADGKRIAYVTDQSGEQEIAVLDLAAGSEPTLITDGGRGWVFGPAWAPDGKSIAYADYTFSLFVVDVQTKESKLVDRSAAWEIREYVFSPDSAWLAYVKPEANELDTIHIYSMSEQHSFPVTTNFTRETSPAWDPKGRYLYFLSSRSFNPLHGELDYQFIVTRTEKPCAVILQANGKSPFLPDELLEDGASDADTAPDPVNDAAKRGAKTETVVAPVEIDIQGITSRVVEFPVAADAYGALRATADKVFYLRQPMRGRRGLFEKDAKNRLMAYDLKAKEESVRAERVSDYTLSGDGKRIAYRVDKKILVEGVDSKGERDADALDPSELSLRVEPSAEWRQIFVEAWRLQRDFYWAENLANVDWVDIRKKYEVLLPRIGSRDELNDLIGQMFAELGTSHTYITGGDLEQARRVGVGLLGAELEVDEASGLHRFARILRPEVWETDVRSPLTMSHARVQEGEYLFAVDGRDLPASANVYDALANRAEQEVVLTVGLSADRGDARNIQINTLADERNLRLRDWVRRNREYVERASGGRIGYLHLPDMSGRGLTEFAKAFYPQVAKPGLIIDVRYNGGGNVSQLVIDRLRRTLWAYMTPRRGVDYTYPFRVHIGHKVVLTNQNAGSDGDIFPESFQVLGLGPVIGMRSWGGVVGIRRDKAFIDGGMSSQPEFAWWHPKKGWGLENRGVEPDIELDILPEDWRARRDPQLDRAIAELEARIAAEPVNHHEKPPLPDKSKPKRG